MSGPPYPPPPPPGWQQPPPPPPGYPPAGYPPAGYAPYYSYPSTHAARFGLQPANFGQRLGAYLLDVCAVMLFALPLIAVAALLVAFNWETERAICTDFDTNRRYSCTQPTGQTVAWIFLAIGLSLLASLAVAIFYWGRLEGQRTQTWGKKVVGIRTLRASTGQPLGFGRAVGRMFARYISGQVCNLGYLWMLWDDNKQTWHDKIVDSIVVKA